MHTQRSQAILPVFVAVMLVSTVAATIIFQYYMYIRNGTAMLLGFSLFLGTYSIILAFQPGTKTHFNFRIYPIDLVIAIFLLYVVIRYLTSPSFQVGVEELCIICVSIASYLFIRVQSTQQKGNIYLSLNVIMLFGLLQSIYALLQWFGILQNIFPFRMGATYGNPGEMANILVVSYAVSLGLMFYEKQNIQKLYTAASALIILLVIILSQARTAWIATLVASLYLLAKPVLTRLIKLNHRVPKWLSFTTLSVLLTLGVIAAQGLYTMKKDSADGRIFIWGQCLELIGERPLFGHGYDSFVPVYTLQQANYFEANPDDEKNAYLADDILFAYNELLHWAVEYGIIGAAFLIALFSLLLIPKRGRMQREVDPMSKISTAGLLTILTAVFFSYPLQNASVLILLFLLAALHISLKHDNEIKLNISILKSFNYLSLTISIILLFISLYFLSYNFKWKRTYEEASLQGEYSQEEYTSLLRVLKYDKAFLYHYGAVLFDQQEYEACHKHFESYKYNTLTSSVLMILGDCYLETGDTDKAELYYQQAHNAKPLLFVPRQKLLSLYRKTDQHHKAHQIALGIKHAKVKVYSEIVKQIKNEAHYYLQQEKLN